MYDRRLLSVCVFIASAGILYSKRQAAQSPSPSPPAAKAHDAWSLDTIASTYSQYKPLADAETNRMSQAFDRLDSESRALGYTVGYHTKLDALARAEEANARITDGIASLAIAEHGLDGSAVASGRVGPVFRVREALQHFVRDWSEEGREERATIFTPILDVLRETEGQRGDPRVLVPGSGLGRLAWEISELGYNTTANEMSHYMNFALRYLVNPVSTPSPGSHTVHPWAHRFSHQRLTKPLFRGIPFPDSLPRLSSSFHTSEGDFLQLSSGNYDFIVTLFFIDTSANVAATLNQIHTLLAPGGTWINLGPLLWAGGGTVGLELSLEEVKHLAKEVGFRMDESKAGARKARTVTCEYTQDPGSMFRRVYDAEFWVAKKA